MVVGSADPLQRRNKLKISLKIKKNTKMAVKERIERPAQTIKAIIAPISNDLKVKVASAFQAVVTTIKVKHLS